MPMLDRPGNINLYLLYAKEDEELKTELERHLSALQRQGYIDVWHDGKISAGEDVSTVQREYLAKAHVILLLISANFLAPDCYNKYEEELANAYKRQKEGKVRIIPVILRDCLWQFDLLATLKPLPSGGHPIRSKHWESQDAALTMVAQELQTVARDLMSTRERIERKMSEVATRVIDYSIEKLEKARNKLQAVEEPVSQAEITTAQEAGNRLLADVLEHLLDAGKVENESRILEFLHPSLLRNGRLDDSFKKNNLDIAKQRAHLYVRPPLVKDASLTGRRSIGFLSSKELGQEWRYTLGRTNTVGGMPGYVRIFFPDDGSPPRVSGLSL